MRKYEIAVYLKLEGSKEIRTILESKGFAIYKQDLWLQNLDHLENNKNLHLLPIGNHSRIFCIYNGKQSLEEMGINQKKLESDKAVIDLRIGYSFQREEAGENLDAQPNI